MPANSARSSDSTLVASPVHHVANRTDCSTCWARPLCAGGCYHEAHVRYGDTGKANLHYCDWIRSWTDTCLKVYGEIAVRNPGYLEQFEG